MVDISMDRTFVQIFSSPIKTTCSLYILAAMDDNSVLDIAMETQTHFNSFPKNTKGINAPLTKI